MPIDAIDAPRSSSRSRDYYDEFSTSYEQHRHHGYHVLIDEIEVAAARKYCQGRVLEAGCGTGLILKRLQPIADEVVGIDLSAGMLAVARDRGLHVVQSSVDVLPFPDDHFDAVVSFKVLAHVPPIQQTLVELCRVTRPGGHLVLEFYNPFSLRGLIKWLKPPTRIGRQFNDEDVFTRFDSLTRIRSYLPRQLELVDTRGVRVLTPVAQIHDLPLLGGLMARAEHAASRAPILRNLGGFLIVILRKR